MKSIIIIGSLFILFPNVLNHQEKEAFSDERRIDRAKEHFHINNLGDSVLVSAGKYYDRNQFHNIIYGKKYRKLWKEPVKVKVLDVDTMKGGLKGEELGGGMQTIGLDMISKNGKTYDLRSVNKDQSKALPKCLRITYLRILFRDQTAAVNPYAAFVIPPLAEAAGIMHTTPQLVLVPYDPSMKLEYRNRMSARLAMLEENVNDSWAGSSKFRFAKQFLDTEEVLDESVAGDMPIDTMQFLRCRLFDLLISDWDRHFGQWDWALVDKNDQLKYVPIPKDRDMAFYNFKGGIFKPIALLVNKKFQTYNENYNVKALTLNGHELDMDILHGQDSSRFTLIAKDLQAKITDEVIEKAFKKYPPEIYKLIGEEHIRILKIRRKKLIGAAKEFYQVIHEK